MQRRAESNYRKQLEEERKRIVDESHWVIKNGESERYSVNVNDFPMLLIFIVFGEKNNKVTHSIIMFYTEIK